MGTLSYRINDVSKACEAGGDAGLALEKAYAIASEADELMEEMHSVLWGCQLGIESKARIEQVLASVDEWKERRD